MTAKIVKLKVSKRGPVSAPMLNLVFPEVYRASAFFVKIDENIQGCLVDEENVTASDQPAPPFYTLDLEADNGYANVTREAITRMDPTIDSGWIFIRHHKSAEAADAYLDGITDMQHEWKDDDFCFYSTEFGIFSFLHRAPTQGRPNHFLIYTCKVPDLTVGGLMDYTQVISPDGKVSDADILMPEEVAAYYGEMVDILKDQ